MNHAHENSPGEIADPRVPPASVFLAEHGTGHGRASASGLPQLSSPGFRATLMGPD